MTWYNLRQQPSLQLQWIFFLVLLIISALVNRGTIKALGSAFGVLPSEGGEPPSVPDWTKKCLLSSSDPFSRWIQARRGPRYLLSEACDCECTVSWWNLSHLGTYAGVGFLAPDLILPATVASVGWELAESTEGVDCEDISDLLWNFAGFALGAALRKGLVAC